MMKESEEKTIVAMLEKITTHRCTYPDPMDCEHYSEIFDCCQCPSIPCSFHETKTKITSE